MRTFVPAAILLWTGASCVNEIEGGSDDLTGQIRPSPPFEGDPANGAVFGVDVSMWEGPLSPRELDCFWESGVRHVIAGTQVEEITRQQLAVSVARGMTVDAYVYLYWGTDLVTQVETGFAHVTGFPIGTMWLDLEEPTTLGANTLVPRVEAALAACRAHGVTCGIYTGWGFWTTWMNDTTALADAPLWYARYNGKRTLSNWDRERFGGWTAPTGKQWAEEPLCGVGVDKDTIRVAASPEVVVDRTPPPAPAGPPPAPAPLYPAEGAQVGIDHVKLIVDTVPHATRYQLELEHWTGTEYRPWATWTVADPFKKTYPGRDRRYRFRARAENAHGWGPWSAHTRFGYGRVDAPTPSDEPPDAPPPPAGALSPDGVTLSGASVTLRAPAVAGADRYELAIEVASGTLYTPYATYVATAPEKTFYPQVRNTTYRWRVHARVGGVWGEWSPWARFGFE